MKIELEQEDLQALALTVVEKLRPLLTDKNKADDSVFDVQGLAQYLKVDESWVYKQVSLKAIPFFKVGKYIRFKRSAIDRWADKETIKPNLPLKLV